jgi:hypothetical protein
MIVNLPQELQAFIANRIVGSPRGIPRLPFVNDAIKKFLITNKQINIHLL